MFVVQNKKYFLTNNESHNIDTRQRNDLHLAQANLTIYQRGAQYLGIKIFNNLPLEIKIVADNCNRPDRKREGFMTGTRSLVL